jgi:phosphoribosyl-ATP pyrophosphohydrolase
MSRKSFDELWSQLNALAKERPAESSTVMSLDSGIHAIGKKVLEEAGEVWLAAEYQSNDELATEISQLLYHLQVLMLARGISLDDVYKRL